jgi:hypothetical protein
MEQVGIVTILLQTSYVNLVHKDCALSKQNQLMVQNKLKSQSWNYFNYFTLTCVEPLLSSSLYEFFTHLTFINDYNFYGWVDFL